MLILAIAEDFHKLLEYSSLAPITLLRELCGIVVVTVDAALMLVVTIPRSKDCRAHGACEMLNVVFPLQGCYI